MGRMVDRQDKRKKIWVKVDFNISLYFFKNSGTEEKWRLCWQTAPVSLFAHTFYTSIPVVFPLHPPIRSTSLLKAISQSCKLTEGFPHIQTAMSQMDAAFMQIWKGPNLRWCLGRTLLTDFSRMWRLREREHALLRTDLCSIIELSSVSLLHHMV